MRNGQKARVDFIFNDEYTQPVIGLIIRENGGFMQSAWTRTGFFFIDNTESDFDIIKEWQDLKKKKKIMQYRYTNKLTSENEYYYYRSTSWTSLGENPDENTVFTETREIEVDE